MIHARSSRRTRFVATSAAGLLAVAGAVVTAAPAAAAPPAAGTACDTVEELLDCVTPAGVQEHLSEFQAIADANDGTRASGFPGYTASADYVTERLEAAGYRVTRQPFDFDYYEVVGTPTLARTSAPMASFVYSTDGATGDFQDMSYSGSGSVEGAIVPIDVASADSGCEEGDFPVAAANQVALIKRGACDFAVKAANAETAGYDAAIIYNDGADETRTGLINGTLGGPVGIPVLDTTFALGEELAAPGTTVAIDIETISETRSTENVIAQLPGRANHDVIAVGAHLDSVPEGAGINDNGSGSAAILEVAENLAGARPENGIRFAWWGAEESGLVGSQYYVDSLSQGQLKKISAYLNFDMLGSSELRPLRLRRRRLDVPGRAGGLRDAGVGRDRDAVRGVLRLAGPPLRGHRVRRAQRLPGVRRRGDPVRWALHRGRGHASRPSRSRGTAGRRDEPFDPCYHAACDDIDNINFEVLDQNADADRLRHADPGAAGAPRR